jgi:hypothetical protein
MCYGSLALGASFSSRLSLLCFLALVVPHTICVHILHAQPSSIHTSQRAAQDQWEDEFENEACTGLEIGVLTREENAGSWGFRAQPRRG